MSQPSATLVDIVREQAAKRGDGIAYEFEGRRTSFEALDAETDRVANGLIAMGLGKGGRIAYLGKNSDAYFELLLGAAKAGVVMTPVNWRLAAPEAAYIVNDCSAAVLFVGPEFVALARGIQDQLTNVRAIITTEGGAPEWQGFVAWRDAQRNEAPDVAVNRADVAIQLYTSGTTGKPKGAMLSHGNLLNMVQAVPEAEMPQWNCWTSDDVILLAMPTFHIGGTQWGVNSLAFGAKGVIVREFDAETVLEYFEQSGITKLFMVPSAMKIVLGTPRAASTDFPGLPTFSMAPRQSPRRSCANVSRFSNAASCRSMA